MYQMHVILHVHQAQQVIEDALDAAESGVPVE